MFIPLFFSTFLHQRPRPTPPQYDIFAGAPAGVRPAHIVPTGTSILPNGRLLTPAGEKMFTGYDLWNVYTSPDGSTVVGISDDQLTVYSGGVRRMIQVPRLAPCGAFVPHSNLFLVSLGDANKLALYDTTTWRQIGEIPLKADDGYITDLAVTHDGKTAYGLDVAHETLLTFDLAARTEIGSVAAGREPYAIVLDPATNSLLVANIGLFDYKLIPPTRDGKGLNEGITFPPFAFPSKEAVTGVEDEGRFVPGLGPINSASAQSVYRYTIQSDRLPVFDRSAHCGVLVHAPAMNGKAIGGSAPNALTLANGRLYVSNANNDTVQEFDSTTLALLRTFDLSPTPETKNLRGVIPSGLVASPDGTKLYVCESGLNAIAAIDLTTGKVMGDIPTGWFPMQVRLTPDGKDLLVATQKGVGRGAYGPLNPRPKSDPRYGLSDTPGMIEKIRIPSSSGWARGREQVIHNTGLDRFLKKPIQLPKQIQYVVFITKENHTFDAIFGGMKGVNGEPRYAEFGMQGWLRENGTKTRLPIMPNHIKLAEQFTLSDNFFLEPHYSGDGHRWLVGIYPSLWSTRLYYDGWDFKTDPSTPGRYVSYGSNGSQIPEDYLENGSLWEHLQGGGVTFRSYGEGFEFPGVDEGARHSRSGAVEVANFPMPAALYDNTCRDFPIFNMHIPDIDRTDWFIDDINKNFRAPHMPLPHFMNIDLCNDHGTEANPQEGYPYRASYMADNDLALGRLVEYLSHTPEWKHMVIFVTEDDPGGDFDHVERHRSVFLAIGPYVKHQYVSHNHGSMMSIIRTIYMLFGLGPNNMFDAVASPLTDIFTTHPDFTPYEHVEEDPRVFKPGDTMAPEDPGFSKLRKEASIEMDDPADIKKVEEGFILPPPAHGK